MTGRGRARRLGERLSPRDLAILTTLRELRIASGGQLGRLHVNGDQPTTHARKTRAALQRLTDLRLIVRLERRVGGVRAGSAGYTYGLSGLGLAVLDLDDQPRQRHRRVVETKPAFHNHAVAVAETYVELVERSRTGAARLLEFAGEPGCWRRFPGSLGQLVTLKPDAFVRLSVGSYEVSAFVEVDLATESLTTITRKASVYVAYWRSGLEQRRHDLFPAVWWLVPDAVRGAAIARTIQHLPQGFHRLFVVCLRSEVAGLLTQLPGGGAQ